MTKLVERRIKEEKLQQREREREEGEKKTKALADQMPLLEERE